jgi:hypothetical protein
MDTYSVMTFREFVALREGLNLPDRPPAEGLPRINPSPATNAHRRRIKGDPSPPTARKVAEIVPQKLILKRVPWRPCPPW